MNAALAAREPALLAAGIGIAAKIITALTLDLTVEQQSLMNAAILALSGLITAIITKDGASAGILGVAQALIALGIGFGLRIDPDTQALIMSGVATIVGMYERTQVTAPAPPPPA